MSDQSVLTERRGSTLVVTLNRPEARNALDGPTIVGIGTALTEAEADDSVRVVVITGAGDKVFCAGADLRSKAPRPDGPGLEVLQTRCYPKPLIAALNGSAVGGGLELMMCCDIVVAAEHATFSVPEAKRGLVGAGCSTRLAGRVPIAIAMEMVLTGEPFDVRRAHELGLVNEVVPAADLMDRALAMADRIATGAPLALAWSKQRVYEESGQHTPEEWAAIRGSAAPIFASEDAKEGRAAFAEKRTPVWSGR
jgi:enoyl-CoA hydratase